MTGAGTARELPPVGRYLADEVGQLAGVSGLTIGQWARRGYIRASRQADEYPYIYAYQDVAEAMVVHELIERGLNMRFLRSTIDALREQVGTDWPLANSKLYVPRATGEQATHKMGRKRTLGVWRGDHIYDLGRGHAVLPESDLVSIATDLRRGGWAARQLGDLEYIEVNPQRLSGRPTIKGRRIPAETVARIAAESHGEENLLVGYDLTVAQIRDAVRWWDRVRSFEDAA